MSNFALTTALLYGLVYIPFAYFSGKVDKDLTLTALTIVCTQLFVWTSMKYWHRINPSLPNRPGWNYFKFDWRALLCGIFTAGIIGGTIEAFSYRDNTFRTVLIVSAGIILIAPYADWITKNRIRKASYLAALFALISIISAYWHKTTSTEIPSSLIAAWLICTVSYALKLPLFSAIKRDEKQLFSFLVSHQTVAVFCFLGWTLYQYGLPEFSYGPVLIGIFSQLNGLFGTMLLLSKEEHTAIIPLKTITKISAGLISALLLSQTLLIGQLFAFACILCSLYSLYRREK